MMMRVLFVCMCVLFSFSTFSNKINNPENPIKVTLHSEDDMIELNPLTTAVKDILIVDEKGTIVGHIEEVPKRMMLSTQSWEKGEYKLLYTINGESYKEIVIIQ